MTDSWLPSEDGDPADAPSDIDELLLIQQLFRQRGVTAPTQVGEQGVGEGSGRRGGGGGEHDPLAGLTYDEVTSYTCDHQGMAELFVDRFGHNIRWDDDLQRFMVYLLNEGRWHQDGKGNEEVWRLIRQLALRVSEVTEQAIGATDIPALLASGDRGQRAEGRQRAGAMRAWYGVFKGAGNTGGVIRATAPSVTVRRLRDFDSDAYLLHTVSGTYDVRTGELRSPRQVDHVTHLVKVKLNPDLGQQPLHEVAPLFHGMVKRMCAMPGEVGENVVAERVAAITRWLGYCLHGSNPEKKMALLIGSTNIGKNQVLEVVGELLGQELSWLGARPQMLIKTRGDRHDAEESSLAGRRMVLLNELTQDMRLDDGQVLRLVNPEGTTVALRKMREDLTDVRVTWKLVGSTNELPAARLTPQVVNRLALYPLSKEEIPKTEQWEIKRAVLGQEGEAVLAHLVRWWREWYLEWSAPGSAGGLVVTGEMQRLLSGYQSDNKDLYDQFLEECCELDPSAELPNPQVVWDAYVVYHKSQHPNEDIKYIPGRNKFYKRLEALDGVEIVRETAANGKVRTRGLRGIRMLREGPPTFGQMQAMARD